MDDTTKIAQLKTIDVQRLQQDDPSEAAKVLKACKEQGAFYLDFSDASCVRMMELVEKILDLEKGLFGLSQDKKMKYDIDLEKMGPLKLNGYKPMGRNFGGINGKSDGFESYTIPGKPQFHPGFIRPSFITDNLQHFESFCAETNNVLSLLLSSLSKSLNLPSEQSLSARHRTDAPSPDIIRLLHYQPQPATETGNPQTAHTDLGSLTLLFTGAPGLQVLTPGSKEWAFVMPKKNCAVVNIGDGLSLLTDNVLHSCLHRVGPLPGRAMGERYSFAYLQRTEDDVKLAPLPALSSKSGSDTVDDGSNKADQIFTSKQWLEHKFGMLRAKTWKEGSESQKILTGRVGELP